MSLTKTVPQSKLFVPFSEAVLAATGTSLGELVPFQLEYNCVRLLDGTYEFTRSRSPLGRSSLDRCDGRCLQTDRSMVQAA